MIESFNINFDLELNLENLFKMYHLNIEIFYSKFSFYEL
jgi:hypothetical protein